ncbi:alpha/beta hydrolase [Paenibacillus favisporus]|uniref:alpha/beta fold hydrolase n=1 Tax=Paenibacillus TaxID=44249 RepID=UPI0011AB69BA|nr:MULTISPECIES: alpha/beta hydrolase [Paenibacillus]MEC0178331.1 alpha/beta hydrolase [Paenibacillus favisporus]
MGKLMEIRGTCLFVEDFGDPRHPALLYLHGGPGASCMDFVSTQARTLSERLRVIAIDQRGVLRSDAIKENEPFGIQDIIEDCEHLRGELGIEQWTVLGHSFGGHAALLYAHQYPEHVKKVIYEAPAFDTRRSMKSLLQKALVLFEQENREEAAAECKKFIDGSFTTYELWQQWIRIGNLLGSSRERIYFHKVDPAEYDNLFDPSVATPENWRKSQIHANKLVEEGRFFTNLLPMLPQVMQPSLLLHGVYDPICCEEQLQAFREHCPNGEVAVFENSAHFPRIEEPAKYTRELILFIEK